MIDKKNELISIVIAASQMRGIDAEDAVKEIFQYLETNYVDYEILIVEDIPNVFSRKALKILLKQVPSIRFIELSYEIDYEVAVTVGLENSIGDYVFIFNPRQDPIDAIMQMHDKCTAGIDIVIGVDKKFIGTFGYKIVRPFVQWVLDEIGYNVPKNATSLRCLSRNAVNSATKASNYHHQIFVRISNSGLGITIYEYDTKNRGKSKKSLLGSSREAMQLLIFNSTKPLRWMSFIGFFSSLGAFIFALYSFIIHFVNQNVVEGWSSTAILISTLFMVLFVILSIFGEYLGRLLNDQSNHDPYWVVNESQSSVMVNEDRHNVTETSDKK